MAKGKPKQNGSGGGTRANQGRGGCTTTKKTGQGKKQMIFEIQQSGVESRVIGESQTGRTELLSGGILG